MVLKNELASALRARRSEVAEVFARALAYMPKWAEKIASHQTDLAQFFSAEFDAWVDYLALHFDSVDMTYKQLLIGEKVKAYYVPGATAEQRHADIAAVQALEKNGVQALLGEVLSVQALGYLTEALDEIGQLLLADAPKKQRVLLVGDCLFLDIVPFIVGPLLAQGVSLVTDYATSKNPTDLRDQLRKFSDEKFDLVFFSPFSYDFSLEYSQLKQLRNFSMNNAQLEHVVDTTWKDACTTLDIMADLFDCPIHVHNSAHTLLEESPWKRRLKSALTRNVRHKARAILNDRLATYVQQRNAQAYKHLFVVDEAQMVQVFGELEAGAFFYRSALQHPAVFGRVLALHYVEVVYVNAYLIKKKLVVCDLDNTLWDGVIGEGAVVHFHDRQQILKDLKAKGVVLAINSKNDPANVHWTGGTLADEDFVYANINWEPKVHGMKHIQRELNLKIKDFVFVDDRHDEREMVHAAYPEMLCVDATYAKVWERFAMWRDVLDDDQKMDRTLMYRQREERKAFVKEDMSSEEEKIALFRSLGLKVTISHTQPSDLKRVAELINRTNQFNLEGSRTSFKEVSEWHASSDHLIVSAQTSDRFGDMGTTCVAAVHVKGDQMRLLPFVLSCRVFGYGIEHGVMNYLKQVAANRGVRQMVGRYVETPQNKPCKDFLAQSGFVQEADHWVCAVDGAVVFCTEWLKVEQPAI